MTANDVVDAALAGQDLGEMVTILSLANNADWLRYEVARRASSTIPAPRYKLGEREGLRAWPRRTRRVGEKCRKLSAQ